MFNNLINNFFINKFIYLLNKTFTTKIDLSYLISGYIYLKSNFYRLDLALNLSINLKCQN